MRLLSIDWDYFINATAVERYTKFPDGGNEDIPEFIQDAVWLSHYGYFDELFKVGVNDSRVKRLRTFARDFKGPVVVSESHKDIYQFAKELGVTEIVNIDFHHDFYNFGEEVNCGNWGNKLSEEGVSIFWVSRKDSDDCDNGPKKISFARAMKMSYGAVFLCRSGMWSPPHLDGKFKNLVKCFGREYDLRDRSLSYNKPVVRNFKQAVVDLKGI